MSQGVDTVSCTRCGSGVPLLVLERSVDCPHCKAPIELAAADVEALTRYRTEVRARLDAERGQRAREESWNRSFGGPDAKKKNNPLLPLLVVGTVVLLMGGLIGALQAAGASNQTMSNVVPATFFGIFAAVFGAYLVWYRSGRTQRAPTTLESATVHCPKCGSPHALRVGEVLDRCRFCSAALLPDAGARERGLAAADHALLEAELAHGRAERRGMLTVSASSGARIVPYLVVGSFLPITLFGAVAFTISFLAGQEKDTSAGGILLLWALALLNGGLLGLVYLFRRARQARIDALLGGLCARFAGRPLADAWAANAWLDRHWAGSVPMQHMFRGAHYTTAAFTVQGLPALAIVNPVGASEDYPAFVAFRVSAWLPAREVPHPAVAAARAACAGVGLGLSVERAGLVAIASEGAVRRLIESPEPLRLAGALEEVGRAAHALGGTRVDLPAPSPTD